MKPIKFLIRGGSWVNKGGEAMLCTVQEQLAAMFPKSQFYANLPPEPAMYNASRIFSAWPESQKSNFEKGLLLLRVLIKYPRLLKRLLSDRWATLQAIEVITTADVILDISGFAYSDDWGDSNAARTWTFSYLAHTLGKPYIFLPQAWGPFTNRSLAKFTNEFIDWSPLVCVRDEKSMAYIKELIGGESKQIHLTTDIAFLFRAEQLRFGKELISELFPKKGSEPIIGFAPNMRVYERMTGEGKENQYVLLMADLISWAIRQGSLVLLIPHEISFAENAKDDRFLCRLIMDRVGENEAVAMLDGMYSASEVKSVIGCIDFLVGSRFHSIVAAISYRVPAVVLGWSHKYIELMRSVGMEKLVFDYGRLNTKEVIDRLDKAWKNRMDIRDKLERKMPLVEASAASIFTMVARQIKDFYCEH